MNRAAILWIGFVAFKIAVSFDRTLTVLGLSLFESWLAAAAEFADR